VRFLLEMSLAGTLLIAVVVLIRALVMHKLPKKTFLVLWVIVLFRLLIPFSIPSQVSVFNLVGQIGRSEVPTEHVATEYQHPINPSQVISPMQPAPVLSFQQTVSSADTTDITPPMTVTLVEGSPWLPTIVPWMLAYFAGLIVLAVFFTEKYFRHHREFMTSLPTKNPFVIGWLEDNKILRSIEIRVSDKIATPLTYGILRPVILLPKNINWANTKELEYILAHELVHIRRFDALTKLVMAAALCIHWFNPIVWAFCFLFNRDMEISCDEAVVKMFGETSKKGYALTLIGLAERSDNFPALLHNNFSKHAIEERITAIMKMKKVTIIGTLLALILVATTAVVFATTGIDGNGEYSPPTTHQERYESDTPQSDDTDIPVTAVPSTQSQFHIEIGEFFRSEPGAGDITAQEAAQAGADSLVELFEADLNGVVILMHFVERFEAGTGRGQDLTWAIDLVNSWTEELGMTVDEILNYIRARSERDYTFEIGLDVDSLASVVGLTSEEFINIVMMIYIQDRSLAVTEGWAYELGMTLDELFDYMMDGRSMETAANTVGVEVDQFIHVMGSVWNVSMSEWERIEQPSMWHGSITPEGGHWPQYSFTINGETGALMSTNYTPWATDTVGTDMDRPMMMVALDNEGRVPTAQQNNEFSQLAMDIAQETNILGGAISRARIISLGRSFDPTTDNSGMEVTVEVHCVNGNVVIIIFGGFLDGDAILTNIRVIDDPSWVHDQFVFEWVAR